jgi:hypothetical protein
VPTQSVVSPTILPDYDQIEGYAADERRLNDSVVEQLAEHSRLLITRHFDDGEHVSENFVGIMQPYQNMPSQLVCGYTVWFPLENRPSSDYYCVLTLIIAGRDFGYCLEYMNEWSSSDLAGDRRPLEPAEPVTLADLQAALHDQLL